MAAAESQGRIRRRVLAVAALLALAGAGVVLWKPWEKKPETPEVVHRPDPEPVSEPVREEKDPTPFLPPPLEPDPKPEPEPDPEPEPKPDPGFPEPLMKSIRARVIDTHPYYLQTYLLPEERARLQDLRKAGRGTEEDLEFLRRRILGEVARAIGEDRDSIQAHLDELSSAARKHQKRVDDARRNQAWLAFVDFCRKNDLHRARDYGLYAHLQVDPGHAETRKELGYEPSPFGFWRKKVAARTTEGGIEFEGRVHTRDQLRALLLERGYVVVNKQWCQKLKWTGPPSKPFFTNAREFQVYKWRVRQVYDPFAKMELQMRLFEPRWTYYGPEPIGERSGECEGTVSIRVEGRLPFAECRVRAPARILEGGGSVKFRVEVGGTRSELYELKKGEKDEMIDISNFVRGSRRFTLSAVLTCPYDGRDNRSARFLPGDRKFEIVADVAMAVPELTRLLGTDKPVSDPALARKMLVEAAGRLITGKQDITEACMRIAGEAALLKYDGPIETPLEFEGLARIIGHPVSFDPDKLPEDQLKKLHRAWNGFALDKKREFAAWFGLWYAREKFRSGD